MLTLALVSMMTAAPACDARVAKLEGWLKVAAASRDRGAVLGFDSFPLAPLPLRKSAAPPAPAMTLVLTPTGVRDGMRPERPVEQAGLVIANNPNINWAASNPNAFFQGIVIEAHDDAPARLVREVLHTIRKETKQKAWLAFKPAPAALEAPPNTELTQKLDGNDNTQAVADVVRREFGPCEGLMKMMRSMSTSGNKTRLDALVQDPPAALRSCKCAASPENVATILWFLGLRDLVLHLPTPNTAEAIDKLPWGDPKAKWADVAAAVGKAL